MAQVNYAPYIYAAKVDTSQVFQLFVLTPITGNLRLKPKNTPPFYFDTNASTGLKTCVMEYDLVVDPALTNVLEGHSWHYIRIDLTSTASVSAIKIVIKQTGGTAMFNTIELDDVQIIEKEIPPPIAYGMPHCYLFFLEKTIIHYPNIVIPLKDDFPITPEKALDILIADECYHSRIYTDVNADQAAKKIHYPELTNQNQYFGYTLYQGYTQFITMKKSNNGIVGAFGKIKIKNRNSNSTPND